MVYSVLLNSCILRLLPSRNASITVVMPFFLRVVESFFLNLALEIKLIIQIAISIASLLDCS